MLRCTCCPAILIIDETLKLRDELEKKDNEIELLKRNQDERILLLEAQHKEIAEHLKNLKPLRVSNA